MRGFNIALLLAALGVKSVLAGQDCTGILAASPKCKSEEANHRRDFFYIGGSYIPNTDPNLKGTIRSDQIYVEKLTPKRVNKDYNPLVFFHGGGTTGVTWLQTPDNRKGWASWFLEKGYQVYIVDQTSVGRGSQQDFPGYPLRLGSTSEVAQQAFTRIEDAPNFPPGKLHTQWPGEGDNKGKMGDPFFDAFVGTFLPLTTDMERQELSMRSAGCALLKIIGPSFLISHSIGALHPALMSDECPELVAGNVNLEPTTIPFTTYNADNSMAPARPWGLTNTRLTYDPPAANAADIETEVVGIDTPEKRNCKLQKNPARKLPNLAKVPYVAYTAEASQHITVDHCIIDYLKQAGVTADWVKLSDEGIHGNAHFFFLEKNNIEIAKLVNKWIEKTMKDKKDHGR